MKPENLYPASKDQLNLVLSFFSRVDAKLSVVLAVDTGMLAVLAGDAPPVKSLSYLMIIFVWIGRAPNVAAKLSAIRDRYATYITKAVFDVINDNRNYGGDPRRIMWEAATWSRGTAYGVTDLYRSNWTWKP